MEHKSFALLESKADGESGQFTALVSTFGNVDKVGDRIVRGAYSKTLERYRKSGNPIPIVFAHDWSNPWAHIGYADAKDVTETERGLLVKGHLDIGDNEVAKQVWRLMKRGTLKEFSIGYSVPPGGERRAKDGANEITEIDLAECGPCLKGIDPNTELHTVKAAVMAAGDGSADVGTRPGGDDGDQELHQLKAQVAELAARVEELEEKAEVASKEPEQVREVDPLLEQSRQAVLEIQSDGASLRKSPEPAEPEPEPEPIDEAELRRRSRDAMFEVLAGS